MGEILALACGVSFAISACASPGRNNKGARYNWTRLLAAAPLRGPRVSAAAGQNVTASHDRLRTAGIHASPRSRTP